MSFIRTPNLTGQVRRASVSAPTVPSSDLAASMANTLRRMSIPLPSALASSPSPSTTMQHTATLRRMPARDPSPPLDLEPSSQLAVGHLKRIPLKSLDDDVEPLTPLMRVKLALGFMPKLLSATPTSVQPLPRVVYDLTEEQGRRSPAASPMPSSVRFSVDA